MVWGVRLRFAEFGLVTTGVEFKELGPLKGGAPQRATTASAGPSSFHTYVCGVIVAVFWLW